MTDTTDIAALRKRLQSAISQHEMMMGCVMGLSRVDPMYQQCLDALNDLEAERQRADDYAQVAHGLDGEIAALKADVLVMPDDLHPDTKALVLVFASAMAVKLHKAQKKYGYDNSWMDTDWKDQCQRDLIAHVTKGDPLDVAAYSAFAWHHGWPTAPKPSVKGE